MGVKTDLKSSYRHSFVCIIDGDKVVEEVSSPDKELFLHYNKGNVDAQIESRGWNCVKSANAPVKITINGTQYAVNKRGLNIVLLDKKSQNVVDSVAIDFFNDARIVRDSSGNTSLYDELDLANQELRNRLNDKQQEMDDWINKYNTLEKEKNSILSVTQKELEETTKNVENLTARLSDMEKSLSFRTGRAITYIPRKIRDLLKKK